MHFADGAAEEVDALAVKVRAADLPPQNQTHIERAESVEVEVEVIKVKPISPVTNISDTEKDDKLINNAIADSVAQLKISAAVANAAEEDETKFSSELKKLAKVAEANNGGQETKQVNKQLQLSKLQQFTEEYTATVGIKYVVELENDHIRILKKVNAVLPSLVSNVLKRRRRLDSKI